MKTAEYDVGAARPVMVGDAVSAVRVGDVDLDDDQIRVVVEGERLNVLVLIVASMSRSRYAASVADRAAETASI